MALVGYSDSEGSDSETTSPQSAPKPAARISKPGFQKVVDPSAPRKIKVELPTVKDDAAEEARPAKKARTGGGFGGFNSFLPAPKRTAEANGAKKIGLGAGVSLKTGAAPAFSREPVEVADLVPATDGHDEGSTTTAGALSLPPPNVPEEEKPKEVKAVGNAMIFKPLSVAKKKPGKKRIIPGATVTEPAAKAASATETATPAAPPPKPKVSLFSVVQEETTTPSSGLASGDYRPIMSETTETAPADTTSPAYAQTAPTRANTNSLDAIASDLNLTAAQRRQLFGRNRDASAFSNINIVNFNTDAEYAANEQLRAQGEAVEHRAVKSVAPGKHSLQQLVNAASSQKEALEDAWAQGKRNKSEAGGKYGW
ncbi:hypothetical protein H2203_009213 [Taxawa tesnikishii (nom. ined.)]|nr:hypothetical protein H2203_009213 [Dothideales sp. JES 119]